MNGLAGWHPNPSRPAAHRDKRYRTGARPVAGAGYNINYRTTIKSVTVN